MTKQEEKEVAPVIVTPHDTNPDYGQGDPIPAAIPMPFTVPNQPWQMPPGSAIPV
jgi:hypothetical protein